jgi:hypothetical protein
MSAQTTGIGRLVDEIVAAAGADFRNAGAKLMMVKARSTGVQSESRTAANMIPE